MLVAQVYLCHFTNISERLFEVLRVYKTSLSVETYGLTCLHISVLGVWSSIHTMNISVTLWDRLQSIKSLDFDLVAPKGVGLSVYTGIQQSMTLAKQGSLLGGRLASIVCIGTDTCRHLHTTGEPNGNVLKVSQKNRKYFPINNDVLPNRDQRKFLSGAPEWWSLSSMN